MKFLKIYLETNLKKIFFFNKFKFKFNQEEIFNIFLFTLEI